MNTTKRIKQIVALTVHDFYSHGYSTNQSLKDFTAWLVEDLLKVEDIENLNTVEISLMVLDKLKAIEIIDLQFIHELVLKDHNHKIKVSLCIDSEVIL